ncbi:ABC transporter substrate-binding protein [Sporolactobacillus sp. STCC-11]|uniref:ABC transporter substrate-binding protein n=1 Tax=Sporolactobacillus caesalpiniae TaxID=3230362 RepID=UPI0033987E94
MNKKLLLIVVAMLMVLTSACSSNPKSGNSSKNKQLTIALPSDATTLLANTDVNSATDVQIRNIYDPLIKRDAKTGEFKPWLATKWKSINSKTWEFTLRKGVKFQNGKPFNAEAVKGSVDYILDKANKSAYLSRWAAIKDVKVVNDYTVQIITSTPYPTFLHRIADDFLVMEPSYLKKVGLKKAAVDPVGTGPYKFKEWKRNQYLKLSVNKQYWAGKPNVKKVEFRYIPEFSSRMASFLNGEIDLFDNVPVDSVKQIKSSSTGKIEQVKSARVDYLALNTFSNGPMKNQKVRQAINYAVDVPNLLKTQLNGYGVQITGPLAKNNQDYVSTKGYTYDPKKAVSLLKEAGYDPKKLTLTLDTPSGRYPMDKQVSQAIAAQLEKIGIKVNVHVNEWGAHLAKITQHRAGDMFFLGWGPSYEGQTTIQNLFTKNAPYSGFYDPKVESAINKALPLFKESERKEAFGKVEQMLVDKAAWVPLWQQENLYAVNKSLNFTPRTDETLQIFDMSWK